MFTQNSLILNNSVERKYRFNVKTVLFQAIRFSISTRFSFILPIDRTLSGATNPDQSGPRSDSNEGVLCIHQRSSFTGTSPDCLVSYLGHSLWRRVYPFADKQSVFSTVHIPPADWAKVTKIIFSRYLELQVTLPNTCNLCLVTWYHAFLYNTNDFQTDLFDS